MTIDTNKEWEDLNLFEKIRHGTQTTYELKRIFFTFLKNQDQLTPTEENDDYRSKNT